MELKKFKLTSIRQALWVGKEVPAESTVAIIATETEEEARWFFGKINFTAWRLEPVVDEPKQYAAKGNK